METNMKVSSKMIEETEQVERATVKVAFTKVIGWTTCLMARVRESMPRE